MLPLVATLALPLATRAVPALLALLACGAPPAPTDAGIDAGLDAGAALDPREITEPMPLLHADGTVSAHGWARGPLVEYDRAAVAPEVAERVREWEFYAIFAPGFALSVTLADVGVATVGTLTVQDYATGVRHEETILGGGEDLALPATPYGDTRWDRPAGFVEYGYDAGTRTIRFGAGDAGLWERAEADLVVLEDPASESVAVVTRFEDPRLFFYENKRVDMTATGTVRIGEASWTLPAEGAYAVLDWGRGAWPPEVRWDWAAASGTSSGRRVGINLGTVHGDDSRGTADAVIVDGVLHKLGRVRWDYDVEDLLAPWRFTTEDGRLDLVLAPDFDDSSTLDLGRMGMRTWKVHGILSGTVALDDGSTLPIEGVRGIAEHVEIAW